MHLLDVSLKRCVSKELGFRGELEIKHEAPEKTWLSHPRSVASDIDCITFKTGKMGNNF